MSDIARSAIWHALLPRGIVAYETSTFCQVSELFEVERKCVANAVPKRVAEFAAGRLCARIALADLGYSDFPVLRGADRRPLWPDGVVGSITHTDHYCASVVARGVDFASIGIDAEEIDRLDDTILGQICTPNEHSMLMAMRAPKRQQFAALTFSAKEAIYKCHASAGGGPFGFQDIELRFEDGRFVVSNWSAPKTPPPAGAPLVGTYLADKGRVYTAFVFNGR